MTTRASDVIARFFVEKGIRHLFLVTGGGAMHLNDAFGRTPGLNWLACHHEQTCAMAAESYARLTGRPALVNVTTGPGGTNAITGVYGAYTDSLPMVVVSGQVKWETLVRSTELPLRQLGDQEVDITRLVAPITKYAAMITDPKRVRYHCERAWHLATTGRPGPVWLDVPMNVQGALVDPSQQEGYDPQEDAIPFATDMTAACQTILGRLAKAKRPVVMPGSGIRISGQFEAFRRFVDRMGIPVVTAFNAHDLVPDDHPLYAGRPGTVGDRAGNFAVQNSDFLLVLGCRLNIRQISYGFQAFAREAWTAMVDIDEAELKKPTLRIDLPVHGDLAAFFATMQALPAPTPTADHEAYVHFCRSRVAKYPTVLPAYRAKSKPVNPYVFAEALFDGVADDEIIVTADGTACVVTFQAARIRQHRLFSNSGSAPMGFDIPAAIGAAVGAEGKRVVCVAGDGSLQMNLQDLQTIVGHKLPVKIFVVNNGGYHSIRQTQTAYFPDNAIGAGPDSGVTFPDLAKIAAAYGLPFQRIDDQEGLAAAIRRTLDEPGPALCEVIVDKDQPFAPKLSSRRLPDGTMVSAPLEDMAPFLPRDELRESILVTPMPDTFK